MAAYVLFLFLWFELPRQQSSDRSYCRLRNDLGNDQEGSRKLELLAGNSKDRSQVQVHVRCYASNRWCYGVFGMFCTGTMENHATCRHRAAGSDGRLSLHFTVRAQSTRRYRC